MRVGICRYTDLFCFIFKSLLDRGPFCGATGTPCFWLRMTAHEFQSQAALLLLLLNDPQSHLWLLGPSTEPRSLTPEASMIPVCQPNPASTLCGKCNLTLTSLYGDCALSDEFPTLPESLSLDPHPDGRLRHSDRSLLLLKLTWQLLYVVVLQKHLWVLGSKIVRIVYYISTCSVTITTWNFFGQPAINFLCAFLYFFCPPNG